MSEAKAPSRHYPAPYALIDLWAAYGGDPGTMKEKEIESFARLLHSDTAQNLMRVFFLRQSMKNLARKEPDIRHVHVVGAGEMGSDIAAWCAMQGMRITLSDQEVEPLGKTVRKTVALCEDQHNSSIETRKTLDRLIPDVKNTGVAKADLIIEAVPENIDMKHKVYQSIEPHMKIGAVLATNTSSLPLDKLAERLRQPERLAGLHFFNPVSKVLVVEVVSHDQIGKNTKEMALAFTEQIGKLPAPVASYPGFLVNRALMPYLLEALVMMDENIKKETIDRAAEHFGMPLGPIEVADQVGLDICLDVADMLKQMLDKPMAEIPDWLRDKVEKGELGKKTGQGFYEWKDGKAQKEDIDEQPDEEITDRLILPMLNACVECFREGVIDDWDILDGAMIFATGFAPFRGGPMHYARSRGIDAIGGRLEALADAHGERFRPDEGWQTLKVH